MNRNGNGFCNGAGTGSSSGGNGQQNHHQNGGRWPRIIRIGSGSGRGSPDSTTTHPTQHGEVQNLTSPSPAGGGGAVAVPRRRPTPTTPAPATPAASATATTTAPAMYEIKSSTQLLAFQRSLAAMWRNEVGTDAALLCQGTRLPAHKIILMAVSPYVTSVVETMGPAAAHMMPVIAVDIPPEAGQALLSYVYTGEAQVQATLFPHVVAGARFLGISGFGEPPGVPGSRSGTPSGGRDRTNQVVPAPVPSPSPSSSQSSGQGQGHRSHSRSSSSRVSHFANGADESSSSSQLGNLLRAQNARNSIQNRLFARAAAAATPSPPSFPSNSSSNPLNLGNENEEDDDEIFVIEAGDDVDDDDDADNVNYVNVSENSQSRNHGAGSRSGSYYNHSPAHSGHSGTGTGTGSGHGSDHHQDFYMEEEDAQQLDQMPEVPEEDHEYVDGDDEDFDDVEDGRIPAQLLNPNVEYYFGNEYSNEASGESNEFDQQSVAVAMETSQNTNAPRPQPQRLSMPPGGGGQVMTKPKKKSLQPNVCEICGKTFSNAYNLRVHMDGHSGKSFPCPACSHISPSRDALRKHFSYRHRELWRSGMTAFDKNDRGRKY